MRTFEIKKQRNISQIIEDSFAFFRVNFKKLIKIIWEQNRYFIIGLLISYFMFIYYYYGMFNFATLRDNTKFEDMLTPQFAVTALALLVFSTIFFLRFFTAILGYLKYYNPETEEVDEEKVKELVNYKFWGLIVLSIILFILMFIIGALLFALFTGLSMLGGFGVFLGVILLLPIIFYLIVYFTLVYYVYILDDVSYGEALTRTMDYLKNRFWFSLGVMFLMGLIIGLIGIVFQAPVSIYMAVKTMMMIKEPNQAAQLVAGGGDIIISIFSVISYVGQTILRILYFIAISFLFYSLKEYHTGESLLEKIDKIGDNEPTRDV